MPHKPTDKRIKNLIPANKRTKAERVAMGRKGGIKSAEKQKEQKKCAEVLRLLVDKVYKDKKGTKADGREVLMVTLFNKAVKQGDMQAMKLILTLLGEMPKPNDNERKESADNGILEGLLQANLQIQKEKGNINAEEE